MIQFTQVAKAFGTQQVIQEATFTVHPGERVGVVGPNGAGKSTLFEMLSGNIMPDKGELSYPSSLRLGYVRQQLHDVPAEISLINYTENALPELNAMHDEISRLEHALTAVTGDEQTRILNRLGALQTEYEHLGGYELRARAEATLSGLGFAVARFDDPFTTFSGGWKTRSELARILVSRPDVLLLDEPTNYLDVPAVEWLRDYLKNYSGTLLLISHDRYLLNSLTSVTLEVMGGRVTRYPGNYAQYVQDREARHDQLIAQKRNLDRRKEQLERFVERFRAKATKAAQAQSRQKMLDKLEDVDIPQVTVKPPRIILPVPPRSGQEVVRLEQACFSYDGKNKVLDKVDLSLDRGEKAAFVGLNGMGKTTLLRLIAGRMPLSSGKLVIGHNVTIGYQSQDYAETMDPQRTVYETVRAVSADRSEGELRNMLGGFGFPGEAIEKQVQVLSGGEKVRLALARLLLRPNNFLLLDEPTTHLDIYAREALEDALRNYQGTLCLVSHDITFVRNLATTIFALTPGAVTRYFGNYDYYRQKLAEQDAAEKQQAAAVATTATPTKAAPATKAANADADLAPATAAPTMSRRDRKREEAQIRSYFSKDRRKWEEAVALQENTITALEEEQNSLYETLAKAEPGTDFETINKRLADIKREMDDAAWAWEEASRALDNVLQRQEERLAAIGNNST
ncbi:MAG: ATP-binding cassette domain-containing protein [Lentisphaerae bacterium]|nr:ATP-binding cassette domain-containing protein [Lentisphaerota bacterium]